MITNKLEKDITLYTNQYNQLCLDTFGDHYLERASLELESLVFRIKYMYKHNLDLDKIDEYKNDFCNKSYEVRKGTAKVIYNLLKNKLGYKDIIDVLIRDIKFDSVYVKLSLVIISDNIDELQKIDDINDVINIYPEKYFRIYTDSYNDAIANAYPELFVNKRVDIGTGADGDVFVHNLTFQTTEACSLECCFGAGTKIRMADGTTKNIEDIKIGDMIFGFDEFSYVLKREIYPVKVLSTFNTEKEVYELIVDNQSILITEDHPVLTSHNKWIKLGELTEVDSLMSVSGFNLTPLREYEVYPTYKKMRVYNMKTSSHTYIAENIAVHNCYCYQHSKSPMIMDFYTAKTFIDHLLNDDYGYINRYNSPAIILEFIGGEPLLEIELTRKIYEYFLSECYRLNHPWFSLHRVSICSNGLQYFEPEVQSFFKDYSSNISFNISIDGNKELHDACRIQPNGEGSYDIAMPALEHYVNHYNNERNSKMTLAPSNIKYLYESVVDFISKGMKSINLNCVFEEGWNTKTANIEYNELIKLADYILENNLENIFISIFNERQEDRQLKENNSPFCGGATGSMLSIRPNGDFYSCIRFMPSSTGIDNTYSLGNVFTSFDGRDNNNELLKMMDSNTRRGEVNDICFNCPIGNDCPGCSAVGIDCFGTPFKRATFICIQVIAEALANVYYWNLLNMKHPEYNLGVRKNNVPDEWALLIIDKDELDKLKLIEISSMISTIENN